MRIKGFVVVTAIALAVAAQGTAAPVSSTYTVGASSLPGVNTGLVLQNGQSVSVTATGSVCPFGGGFCVGPDGDPSVDTTQSLYGGFVLPGAPAWGLVGRVGSGPWMQVGSGPTTVSGTGVLEFAVNDDLFIDNTGSFTVTVTSSSGSDACYPGHGYGDTNHDHSGPPGRASKDSPTTGAGRGK